MHYKNDVYMATEFAWGAVQYATTTGAGGYLHGANLRADRTDMVATDGEPMPVIQGTVDWTYQGTEAQPPAGVTYEEWIACSIEMWQDGELGTDCADVSGPPGSYYASNMWSARKNHQAVVFGGRLYVMGGRAREHAPMRGEAMVGGLLAPPVAPDGNSWYSNWRERSVLRNDVWASDDDGASWSLVTPGCHANQEDLVYAGNAREGRYGPADQACASDADCYGASECRQLGDGAASATCVCTMWSPREDFQLLVFDDGDGAALYVVGGLAALRTDGCGPHGCGAVDASGHRVYMADVWRSYDGEVWEERTLSTAYGGRAGHQVVVLDGQMVLLGGAYGDTGAELTNNTYHADAWYSDDGIEWYELDPQPSWPGRSGHLAVVQQDLPSTSGQRVVVAGGHNSDGFFADAWTWSGAAGDAWVEDYFDPDQTGYTTTTTGAAYKQCFGQRCFVYADAPLSYLRQLLPPTTEVNPQVYDVPVISNAQIAELESLGITTIRELAEIDLYTTVKLRGYDYPTVTVTSDYDVPLTGEDKVDAGADAYVSLASEICDHRALSVAVVAKCTAHDDLIQLYDQQAGMPWNVDVTGAYKAGAPYYQNAKWHGVDYRTLDYSDGTLDADAVAALKAAWNGCDLIAEASGSAESCTYCDVDVPGVGAVPQLASASGAAVGARDPWRELQELHCRWTPLPRAHMEGAFWKEKVVMVGGLTDVDEPAEDMWIRDDVAPETTITSYPSSGSSQTTWKFVANQEGCIFEYRVYSVDESYEVRPWTRARKVDAVGHAETDFLEDVGEGTYIFYVRAIDPAGNRDLYFTAERNDGANKGNLMEWKYVPPLPWGLIIASIFLFLFLCVALYVWYRRRRRRKMLERYAIKRIRRKFKGVGADKEKATNWKALYADQKDGGKKKKKKKKKKKGEDPDAKKKKKKGKKLKDYEKDEKGKKKKKYKDYEKEGGKKKKKYKKYEEDGKKVKKKYKDYEDQVDGKKKKKKYKDYEEKDGGEGGKKYKDYEKKGKRYKDYEGKEEGKEERKKEKRLKDYEKAAANESKTKKKKYKDYEKPKGENKYKANELEYMLDGEDKEEKDPGGDKPRRRKGGKK